MVPFSIMAIFAPWSEAFSAAPKAAEPDPRITKSNMAFNHVSITESSFKRKLARPHPGSLSVPNFNIVEKVQWACLDLVLVDLEKQPKSQS